MGVKRAKSRIVKRKRHASQKKHFNVNALPKTIKENWDEKMSFKQNFDSFGINTDVNKRFRHSKAGREVMKDAQKSIFRAKYGTEMNLSDGEEDEDNLLGLRTEDREKEVRVGLSELFPEIKTVADSTVEKTTKKLKWDEV